MPVFLWRDNRAPLRGDTGRLIRALALSGALIMPGYVSSQSHPDEDSPVELERFAVTGYSIKRTDIAGPAPVDVYERQELERAGVNTLGEFLRDVPQALGQVSSQAQGSGFAGAEFINLRGIGIDNTLTLLNGKRVATYGRNGSAEPFVDISAIPVAAIKRVEILKDGASAIYGADAVAGVVNIILRRQFEGLEIGTGYLTTTENDGEEWRGDLTWGWGSSRTDIITTLSLLDRSPVQARDRAWSDDVDFTELGGPNLRAFNGTPSSYFNLDTFTAIADPECAVDPRVSSIRQFPFLGDICVFNFAWFQQLSYDTESLSANLSLSHEINPTLQGHVEAFYGRRENITRLAPTPVLGGFIPPNHPNNGFGAPLQIAGRPLDTGDRRFDTTADTYRLVAGLEGTGSSWDWSADLFFSGSHVDTDRLNAVFNDRYQAALVGLGGPAGNLWYNPFGANPVNDLALIDWMTTQTQFGADTTENAIELSVTNYFGQLPGGPVGFAAGLQYREQDADEFADEVERSGLLAGGSQITQLKASRNIVAVYGELTLPLSEQLEAQVALRYDDYSDFGNSTNPKIALAWRPGNDWLARASFSTSFRPPTFNELFNPAVFGSGFFVDVERCQVTGAPQDCSQFEYPLVRLGNPLLEPEEGDSWFYGLVWSPNQVEGLSLQLDYWRFEHSERIVELNPQLILDANSDKGVTRAPPTDEDLALGIPGRIVELEQTFENSDLLETAGLDFTAHYDFETANAGHFGLSLSYTYVSEYGLEESALGSVESDLNFAGRYFNFRYGIPRHRGYLNLDWQHRSYGIAAKLHYTGDYEGPFNRHENGLPTAEPWRVETQVTLDLQYRYNFSNQATELRMGCRNCSDEAPPLTFNPQGDGLYDPRGALLYLQLSHGF